MDRLGAMPRRAWLEIRDANGELIQTVSATIHGGTVRAEVPCLPARDPRDHADALRPARGR